MPGTKFDNKKRQTVRSLRIREDTAKVCIVETICFIGTRDTMPVYKHE